VRGEVRKGHRRGRLLSRPSSVENDLLASFPGRLDRCKEKPYTILGYSPFPKALRDGSLSSEKSLRLIGDSMNEGRDVFARHDTSIQDIFKLVECCARNDSAACDQHHKQSRRKWHCFGLLSEIARNEDFDCIADCIRRNGRHRKRAATRESLRTPFFTRTRPASKTSRRDGNRPPLLFLSLVFPREIKLCVT
jgi:hypothetical protein